MPLQIRRLARSEAALLRELRIAALQDAPDEFGEPLAVALTRSDDEWAELTPFAYVAEVDGRCVGMTFAFVDRSDSEAARVGGMWVVPSLRRTGIGLALLEAVLSWARQETKRRIRLWANPASPGLQLYRRANFVLTGAQKPFPRDPSRAVAEMQLELNEWDTAILGGSA
jgi:GNAT superfamily N-acetyltransferase